MRMHAQPPTGRAQIVTLTMNPALDVTTSVDVVRPTEKLRCALPPAAGRMWKSCSPELPNPATSPVTNGFPDEA